MNKYIAMMVESLPPASNEDIAFMQEVIAIYYAAVVCSSMGTTIHGYQDIPVPINAYCFAFADSGSGKGVSTSVIERTVINGFKANYEQLIDKVTDTLLEERSLGDVALKDELRSQLEACGSYMFTFDSATTPAVKQMRQRILMQGIGSINYIVDEFGSNISASKEIMTLFLELYDIGYVRNKLLKSSNENKRERELDGQTAANMLAFGAPSKVIDDKESFAILTEMLEVGYARRSLFSLVKSKGKLETAEEMFNRWCKGSSHVGFNKFFSNLCSVEHLNKKVTIKPEVVKSLFEYAEQSKAYADSLPDRKHIVALDFANRHFKVLKLAGLFAWLDSRLEISQQDLDEAIRVVSLSTANLDKIVTVKPAYVQLVEWLSGQDDYCTVYDIETSLPVFKGTKQQREDIISLAKSYCYSNGYIFNEKFDNGVPLYHASKVVETKDVANDEEQWIVAISEDMTTGYSNVKLNWEEVTQLGKTTGLHYLTHHVVDGYRKGENVIKGFNLIVLDIDDGSTLEQATALFEGMKYCIYTTKRHTPEHHRFRVILPTRYTLALNEDVYKEMMKTIFNSLAIKCDEATSHRVKKWLTNAGELIVGDGRLFDPEPFIKNTQKEVQYRTQTGGNTEGIARWFAANTSKGDRNNSFFRYGAFLKQEGMPLNEIHQKLIELNNSIMNPLPENEIRDTIMKSLTSR